MTSGKFDKVIGNKKDRTVVDAFHRLGVAGFRCVVGLSVFLGLVWTAFDLFVGLLQAFIFMMLAIIYLSQASEHH